MSAEMTRREFAGAAALSAASYARVRGANERIGVGFIGYGLMGKQHVVDFQGQPDVACVAVSDAHRGRLEEAKKFIGPGVRGYADFRRLLEDRDVGAVVVSTPDHWHALMTMMAAAAGKDVYVEKPLTLFVREGRWMVEAAKKHKRVVQVGTQQRSGPHYQRARQLVRDGHIGKIVAARTSSYRNVMPGFGSPADCEPPPELDWNLWLGPAPSRGYNPVRAIYHFRWFWDTSGGQMTNLGQHSLDIVYWTMGQDPVAITSAGGRFALQGAGETPDTQDAIWEFAGPEGSAAWIATWSHREASAGAPEEAPIEFYGTKGALKISRRGFRVYPDRKAAPGASVPEFSGHPVGGPKRPDKPLAGPVSEGKAAEEHWTKAVSEAGNQDEQLVLHVRNFLDCIKSRETPISDLESAHRTVTMCHLANLSLRLGRKIRWDPAGERALGDAEAEAALVRPYRAPWDVEFRALGVG